MGGVEVSSDLTFPAGIGCEQLKVPHWDSPLRRGSSGVWGPEALLLHFPTSQAFGALPPPVGSIRTSGSSIWRTPLKRRHADWGFLRTVAMATIYQTLPGAWSCAQGFLYNISFRRQYLSEAGCYG